MEAENLLEVSDAQLILEPHLTRECSYLKLLKFKDDGTQTHIKCSKGVKIFIKNVRNEI